MMNLVERLKVTIENIRSAADSLGKTLWIFFGTFFAAAIATGDPSLLGAIRDRLILAGVTSLKTPLGEIDPRKMGLQTDTTSRILGISAAHAEELAKSVQDEGTKRELTEMAKQLKEQQHVQIETLNNISSKQRMDKSPLTGDRADMEGWIYLGRRSGDSWRPSSFSIDEPTYPVKSGNGLIIKSDTLLYGAVDCKVIDISDFKTTSAPQSLVFVSASPTEIQIADAPTECPSIGGAKAVWAKVKVPAERLISAKQ